MCTGSNSKQVWAYLSIIDTLMWLAPSKLSLLTKNTFEIFITDTTERKKGKHV